MQITNAACFEHNIFNNFFLNLSYFYAAFFS